MAYKPSPNSLIHCDTCGEDYSATYRRCPFCGAKNAPLPAPAPDPSREAGYESDPQSASGRREAPADLDDTYVFDGQELFDDRDEDDSGASRSRGGKRLAERPLPNPFANADINWPRVITFICSLVIIVAAMVIVFTWIYPQLRDNRDPAANGSGSPSSNVSDPGTSTTQPGNPNVTDPSADTTDPPVGTSSSIPPVGPDQLLSISFPRANDADFTLKPSESHTIILSFNPSGWSGTVTWTSDDTSVATVDANGKVTNVNTTDKLRSTVITATAGGRSIESQVYCQGVAATEPPPTEAPASNPPSGSGGPTAISFNRANDADFTLTPGESHTITLSFSPAGWSGEVTWTSSNTDIATVDANGKVTNVNATGEYRTVTITATAGGISLQSTVRCR